MDHNYVYRKHLRVGFQYWIMYLGIIYSFILIMALGMILADGNGIEKVYLSIFGAVILGFFLFMFLEIGFLYLVFLRRFKSIRVNLTKDAIVYTNSKTQTIIPYEEIEELKFPSIKYTGGWVKIIHKSGNIRLTVVLENIGDFIWELKEKLQESGMTRVYNEKKMFSFFKTAVFADESWDRLFSNMKIHLLAYYSCMVLTIILLMFQGNSSSSKFLIIGSIFAPLAGYLIAEIIIGFQVKKRVKDIELNLLPRNRKFEQKIIRTTYLVATIGYLLLVLLFVIYKNCYST